MNRKTILSMNFPDFLAKWNTYYHNYRQTDYWCITSDYCLDDKDKPNDVMTFSIFPVYNINTLKDDVQKSLPKDIKEIKNILEKAISYIESCPYVFSIVLIIENKNKIFDLEGSKKRLDDLIKSMENWPKAKKDEFMHKIKLFRKYLDRKQINRKLLSNISITVHAMSVIIEFLLLKTNIKHITWISDRDSITNFQNNGIIHLLVRQEFANLVRNRIQDNQIYGILDDGKYNPELLDDLVRIPDYISGSVASMDFENPENVNEKDYELFDKALADNEKVYFMHLKHNKSGDTLSNINFTRVNNS